MEELNNLEVIFLSLVTIFLVIMSLMGMRSLNRRLEEWERHEINGKTFWTKRK